MELQIPEDTIGRKEIAMVKAGVTREKMYRVMAEGLVAMRLEESGDGEMTEVPDHSTRHKFMESALKVTGDIKPDGSIDNRKVVITGVSDELVRGLMSMVADVSEQLGRLKDEGHQTGEVIDVHAIEGHSE